MTCEICEKKTINIKKHHIQSKSLGGSDLPYNIAKLCPECHDNVHNGLIIIEGRFTSLNKDKPNVVLWRYFNEISISGLSDPEVWLKPNHSKLREAFLLKLNKEKILNSTNNNDIKNTIPETTNSIETWLF